MGRNSGAGIATALAAALAAAIVAGCAIRYDRAGVTRVGIGLWGFGDPPGVNWNLDWPRREVPDLPAATRREVPDLPAATRRERSPLREPASARGDIDMLAPLDDAPDRPAATIDDNPVCAPRCAPVSAPAPMASHADVRGDGPDRR
jgi:hypothetical protein